MKKLDYGKYRGIIASIVLFLVLDASVLILNFYMSYQIAEDAIGVNVAGRQRMLSQRITKSLFDIQTSVGDQAELERAIGELDAASTLFNSSFIAFDQGGVTTAPDGRPTMLTAVSSEGSLTAIANAKPIWTPYLNSIQNLLSIDYNRAPEAFSAQLNETLSIGRADNLTLLALMNNLTVDLEAVARSKAETLRLIQTVGTSLAVLNFMIIMFHSVRQLRTSDRQIEAAQKETREILDTVNEGLFLLDIDSVIGDQYSAELESIIGKQDIGGASISDLLRGIVSEKDLSTTQKFLGLLFDPSKKERLLGSLNPLKEVEAHLTNDSGVYQSKFLSFSFSRVWQADEIMHVLVTVKDITKQVMLSRELELAQKQSEQQFELLTTLMSSNSELLPTYLKNSAKTFSKINDYLRTPAKARTQLIDKANSIYREIHNFKGESAALEMDQFVDLAHQFEDEISALKTRPDLSGNDFLSLTIMLNKIISQVEAAQKLMEKIGAINAQTAVQESTEQEKFSWSHLQNLADQVAERQGKHVEVLHSGLNDYVLPPDMQSMINNVSIQLVRNSVTHGIEDEQGRLESEKPKAGAINIRLTKKSDGSFLYSFEDDGQGLDIVAIRESAIERGIVTEAQAETMGRKQIISLIFSPELSTRHDVDQDAGRGVGMASVQKAIRDLGGKLSISSRRGLGCNFSISLPALARSSARAA